MSIYIDPYLDEQWNNVRERMLRERRIVFIPARPELLDEMADWSDPVRVRAEKKEDGTYELIFEKVQ